MEPQRLRGSSITKSLPQHEWWLTMPGNWKLKEGLSLTGSLLDSISSAVFTTYKNFEEEKSLHIWLVSGTS